MSKKYLKTRCPACAGRYLFETVKGIMCDNCSFDEYEEFIVYGWEPAKVVDGWVVIP